jgi:hypothetical protein
MPLPWSWTRSPARAWASASWGEGTRTYKSYRDVWLKTFKGWPKMYIVNRDVLKCTQ